MPADARLVVVVRDLGEESPSALAKLVTGDVPVVASSATWDVLDVPGSPYFVLVDPSGRAYCVTRRNPATGTLP